MSEYRVGDLAFDLRVSPRRTTLGITVDREGLLVLCAPPEADEARLQAFVESKRFWIYKKLAEREKYGERPDPKRYLEGEGFLYLGKSYRLKLVDAQDAPLKLERGRYALDRRRIGEARACFVSWYSERMKARASRLVADFSQRMGVSPMQLIVQDLRYRWGSCGKGDRLYLNWKAILLPPQIVEYVVVHELAHLREAHHTPEYWLIVERALPDYERRKAWLAVHGIEVEGAV